MLPYRTLSIGELASAYRAGRVTPRQVLESVLEEVGRRGAAGNVWISVLPRERIMEYVRALESQDARELPLYGIPFAIKDNIDLEHVPTTAACPDFARLPAESAPVVQRLIAAGAVPVGKTNLDQFATGLVGTRSPYGVCANSIDPAYISGGSSSGSAVAVAAGLVSFALGTDTAGSGRVPAAFNNIIGFKPTNGRLSTRGVVPACRSLDCVSIFALTAEDAARVCAVAEGYDPQDAFSRAPPASMHGIPAAAPVRVGVPRRDQLEFFGDDDYAALFDAAVARLESLGGQRVEVDFAPFREVAKLLYEGPWIAERYAAVGDFIERYPQSVLEVTARIIGAGRNVSGAQVFRGLHRFAELERATSEVWREIDVLLTPTAGTVYRIEDVEREPVRLNLNLGFYTNFVNFLGLSAVAVPAGFRADGLPFGVTLAGPAWSDFELLRLAGALHRAGVQRAGALDAPLPAPPGDLPTAAREAADGVVRLAVCGAHMEGLPLNPQLRDLGAQLVRRARTAPCYRFYALPGGPPSRPGLVRVASGGACIEVEVWSVPAPRLGGFVASIPAPLGIGSVELEDGTRVCGFLCEAYAVAGAEEITRLGGWRAYLTHRGH